MEKIPTEVELEIGVKIVGEGENEDKRFFSSLREALRAFLQEEIRQLTIIGEDILCQFSSFRAKVSKQTTREFLEFFIEAPIVSLRVMGWNREMSDMPRFASLNEGFKAFFEKGYGLQIYQQDHNVVVPGLLEMAKNYMIVFDWNETEPQKVLLHLHNIDVKDKHFWRRDYQVWRHPSGDFDFVPDFGPHHPHHTITNSFSKN